MRPSRLALCLAAAALAGCSWVDGNFNECNQDRDCPEGKSCEVYAANASQKVCLPMPPGCFGVPAAGVVPAYGDLDAGRIHLGASINFLSSAGVNENKVQNLNAIAMALDEINQNLGTGQQTFVLHVCDNAGDSTRVPTQVSWLMTRKLTPAILIPGSANVLAAAQLTLPAGVLVMSPTATSPSITPVARAADGGSPLLWRTAPSDVVQGKVIADLLTGQGSYDAGAQVATAARVGIIYSNEAYGTGLQQVIQDGFHQAQNTSPLVDAGAPRAIDAFAYPRGGDVASAVNQLAAFGPQVTVCIGFPDDVPKIINAAAAFSALNAASGHVWIFTDAAKDPSIVTRVLDPAQLATALGTAPAQSAGAGYPSFAQRFTHRFGVDPSSYGFTSHSYDAAYLLALAASYAVGADGTGLPSGEAMAEGLTRVSDPGAHAYRLQPSDYLGARVDLQAERPIRVEGASGAFRFDPTTGESPAPIEIWGIAGPAFQTLATVTPP